MAENNSEQLKYVLDSILTFDRDDLNHVIYAVKDRKNYLSSDDLKGFRIGDRVQWKHGTGLNKVKYTGTVSKINRKTLGVKEDGRGWVGWRISAGALTKLEETNG
tara:strand:- start:4925 stop:5239 length:315 start_codon:yes stop_codon:yes gene_type:complete